MASSDTSKRNIESLKSIVNGCDPYDADDDEEVPSSILHQSKKRKVISTSPRPKTPVAKQIVKTHIYTYNFSESEPLVFEGVFNAGFATQLRGRMGMANRHLYEFDEGDSDDDDADIDILSPNKPNVLISLQDPGTHSFYRYEYTGGSCQGCIDLENGHGGENQLGHTCGDRKYQFYTNQIKPDTKDAYNLNLGSEKEVYLHVDIVPHGEIIQDAITLAKPAAKSAPSQYVLHLRCGKAALNKGTKEDMEALKTDAHVVTLFGEWQKLVHDGSRLQFKDLIVMQKKKKTVEPLS
jgi:hypothetical protein